MKKIALIILLIFSTVVCCWANDSTEQDSLNVSKYQQRRTMRGFKTFVDAGYLWGLGEGEAPNTEDWSGMFRDDYNWDKFEISVVLGKQFNNFVFVGGGASFDVFTGPSDHKFGAPLFADIRVSFLNDKRVVPFVDVRIGYCIGEMRGLYMSGQIGLRYKISKKYAVFAACQYDYIFQTELDNDRDWLADNLGFKVGFEF